MTEEDIELDKLEVEGRSLILLEAARKHETAKWEHDEKLAKIASEKFCLSDVVGYCCCFTLVGIVIGIFIAVASM